MSKFNAPTPRPTPTPASKAPAIKAPVKGEVRNSPIPKVVPAKQVSSSSGSGRQITQDAIAQRAYFIWKTSGGSEFENWIRAERELRAGK